MTHLTRLMTEGGTASQLYALIAMKVISPNEFAKRIRPYLSSRETVHLLGGDVASVRPVSEVARHIQEGDYSTLLPSSIYMPLAPESRIDSAQ
jgi:hypothetical protein